MLQSCRRSICLARSQRFRFPRAVTSPSLVPQLTRITNRHVRLLTSSLVRRAAPPDSRTKPEEEKSKKSKKKKKKTKKAKKTGEQFNLDSISEHRKLQVFKGALEVLQNVLRGDGAGLGRTEDATVPDQSDSATRPTAAVGDPPTKAATRRARKLARKAEEKAKKPPERRVRGIVRTSKSDAPKQAPKQAPKASSPRSEVGPPLFQDSGADVETMGIVKLDPAMLRLTPIPVEKPQVPSLAYGLDRVLFNPGVYHLQDPHSKVYNFDPYLSNIMPVKDFDFKALKQYVTSSKDPNLIAMAKAHRKRYAGSTSSMTSMLSHFHFLISQWRPVNLDMMSKGFQIDSTRFTEITRAPAATFLHWKNGTYAIDADKEFDTANILSMLGKSMEKLLTLSKEDFERYRHENSDQITEEERNAEESFHLTGYQDFMMRSQLDAYDKRIPGTGMFDLKTRAVVTIRMDAQGYTKGVGYEIRRQHGQWESYEREYYDMIRAAFLKYSLQVRMGRMDGIFVAFHNTRRIFGFQYISLREMDLALHGTAHTGLGDMEFKASLEMLNECLDRATQRWPKQTLRIHVEARGDSTPYLYFFAHPVTPKRVEEIQNAKKTEIEAFEHEMLGLVKSVEEAETAQSEEIEDFGESEEPEHASQTNTSEEVAEKDSSPHEVIEDYATWQEVREKVEEALEDDEQGATLVREAIEDALEQSGIVDVKSSVELRDYVNALIEAVATRRQADQTEEDIEEYNEAETSDDVDQTPVDSQAENPVSDDGSSIPEASGAGNDPASLVTPPQEGNGETATDVLTKDNEDMTAETVPRTSEEQNGSKEETGENEETEEIKEAEKTEGNEGEEGGEETSLRHIQESRGTDTLTGENQKSTGAMVAQRTVESDAAEKETDEYEEAEEEDEEDEAEEEEGERDDDAILNEDGEASSLAPLKNLVVRLAQRINERPIRNLSPHHSDDVSKLKNFEHILGRLILKSKAEELEDETPLVDETAVRGNNQTPLEEATKEETHAAQVPPKSESQKEPQKEAAETATEPELMALVLTVKNKLNGKYVTRPDLVTKDDKWIIEYSVQEIIGSRAQTLYAQAKRRRYATFGAGNKDRDSLWKQMFRGNLAKQAKKGAEYRAKADKQAQKQPVYVFGEDKPQQWSEVFPHRPVQEPEGNQKVQKVQKAPKVQEKKVAKTQKLGGRKKPNRIRKRLEQATDKR